MDQLAIDLKDLKARKGHLCQGGRWDGSTPLCGCDVDLRTVPDFMPPLRDEGSYYAPQVTDPDDDPPPWDVTTPSPLKLDHHADAPLMDPDQLEAAGKEVVDAHGGGEVDMRPSLPLLDPTQPFGPAEIEARIIEANDRLERGAVHEANLVAAAERLGVEYKLAYAAALRASSGTAADIRKADAMLATARLYRQWMDAVAAMKAMQSVTHTLRSTLSGYQSVGRSVAAVYQSPGKGRQ